MNAANAIARGLSFGYRPYAGPLQRARATAAIGWFLALGLVVALYENPLMLAAVLVAVFATAVRCRVAREVAFVVSLSAPLALLVAIVNPVASQQGLTVLVAGIHLPLLGPLLGTFDVTREAVVYGLLLGLRALVLFAICALYVCTVDPDELLRVLRRYAVRSAITASLAVRFVPVLARDGLRMAEARQCRPGAKPGAATVVRAIFARSLDRAGDAALALETRGYALARPLRDRQPARRRADRLVLAAAALVAAVAVAGRFAGVGGFTDYPLTSIATGAGDIAFAVLLAAAAVLPLLLVAGPAGEGERR